MVCILTPANARARFASGQALSQTVEQALRIRGLGAKRDKQAIAKWQDVFAVTAPYVAIKPSKFERLHSDGTTKRAFGRQFNERLHGINQEREPRFVQHVPIVSAAARPKRLIEMTSPPAFVASTSFWPPAVRGDIGFEDSRLLPAP